MSNEENEGVELSENEIIANRKRKLTEWREGEQVFPNHFKPDDLADNIHENFEQFDKETLAEKAHDVSIAGRIMTCRVMGKASFITIQDRTGRIQAYVRKNEVGEALYEAFKHWDLGDIVGIEGKLFKTNKGELTVHADSIELLVKSIRPLPDKYHGLHDQETRYRQRYLDMIANQETRAIFKTRSQIIAFIRQFFVQHDYLEVETPMMQSIPGGATARPFITHHNALDIPLFLRIAPELYLKRLVVGGFERVFEINRNFRNEGISTKHNPEFTMLEFYQAYSDYQDLIQFTETMLSGLCELIHGQQQLVYQGESISFTAPFAQFTLKEAIIAAVDRLTEENVNDLDTLKAAAEQAGISLKGQETVGVLQLELFEQLVEHTLIQPTFITQYPTDVSPLSRRNDQDPSIVDRFELFIAGKEVANGFSELNDPEDQAERFKAQAARKEAGDEEAMYYDADYITALEHGMPPTAGEGIGIDRLVMIMTNSASIRDVLLFPLMRPE